MREKPAKPYPSFPLFAHGNGQWAKKIGGKIHYFGSWENHQTALDRYLKEVDFIRAGVAIPQDEQRLRLVDACNQFLDYKNQQISTDDVSERSWMDYKNTLARLCKMFPRDFPLLGLSSSEFRKVRLKLSETCGPVTLGNEIRRIRTFLNWLYDEDVIDNPIKTGKAFKPPSKAVQRRHRQSQPKKQFSREEILKLVLHAKPQMRAMILLGINGGMGNTDVSSLQHDHITSQVIDFPRTKTAVERQIPLWGITSQAISAVGELDRHLVFKTKYGNEWVRHTRTSVTDSVGREFAKLRLHTGVSRHGFYALRHTFRTVVDPLPDKVAIDRIMGHADNSIAAHYREHIDPSRLEVVTSHVFRWLFDI